MGIIGKLLKHSCSAVVAAAGSSARMEGVNKLTAELCGVPVLIHTLRALDECPEISEIIVVTRESDIQEIAGMCSEYGVKKVAKVIKGGATRMESVYAGVLETSKKSAFIAIHDGARPLASPGLISRTIHSAMNFGAAIAAVPVKDTVKIVDNFTVSATPDRETLYSAQTPQVFKAEIIKPALQNAVDKKLSVTDDCAAAEAMGVNVHISKGDYRNIKITTPEDIAAAEAILKGESGMAADMRIGHGYDVHRLTEGRKLILGGVEIPYEKGLLGHSDADVLIHALMDAMLGAAALGDIGRHFPDTDEKYSGISSVVLLREVSGLVAEKGYSLGNADVTVIAQRPKLAGYIEDMRKNISEALGVSPEKINIKATTEEKLGFTGEGLGIAAHAVAMLCKK